MLDQFRADAREAWLRTVDWANKLSASIFAAVGAAYEARPDAVKGLLQQVPVWAYFLLAVPFFALINHALKRAKNAA